MRLPTIAMALLLPSLALAANEPSPKDFDLACAIAVSAEVAAHPVMSDASFIMFVFYVGRLTARDDSTDWATVVHGRVAELKDNARGSAALVLACFNFFQLKTK